jgi:acetylornithine/N-succinyldiaminopimelate aminotransferase
LLACSAALAVLETLEQDDLIERAERQGRAIHAAFCESLDGVPGIVDIRHKGMMIGIELDLPCGELVSMALAQGLLINVTNEKTIRLLPPLILDEAQIELLVAILSGLIKDYTAQDVTL